MFDGMITEKRQNLSEKETIKKQQPVVLYLKYYTPVYLSISMINGMLAGG